jgi:hypothetical protein
MLSPSQRDREYVNFKDNGDGTTSRYVSISSGLGNLLEGIEFDYIAATYPNATTEVYTYKSGGVSGTTVATVTVVYSNASKAELVSVART